MAYVEHRKVTPVGGSLMVAIPPAYIRKLGLNGGDMLELTEIPQGLLIRRRIPTRTLPTFQEPVKPSESRAALEKRKVELEAQVAVATERHKSSLRGVDPALVRQADGDLKALQAMILLVRDELQAWQRYDILLEEFVESNRKLKLFQKIAKSPPNCPKCGSPGQLLDSPQQPEIKFWGAKVDWTVCFECSRPALDCGLRFRVHPDNPDEDDDGSSRKI